MPRYDEEGVPPMTDIILHHYDISPYSEKVRLGLGLKRLAWGSVEIPVIMPKPDLTALTGGYRKAPVLQIGADVCRRGARRKNEASRAGPGAHTGRSQSTHSTARGGGWASAVYTDLQRCRAQRCR